MKKNTLVYGMVIIMLLSLAIVQAQLSAGTSLERSSTFNGQKSTTVCTGDDHDDDLAGCIEAFNDKSDLCADDETPELEHCSTQGNSCDQGTGLSCTCSYKCI